MEFLRAVPPACVGAVGFAYAVVSLRYPVEITRNNRKGSVVRAEAGGNLDSHTAALVPEADEIGALVRGWGASRLSVQGRTAVSVDRRGRARGEIVDEYIKGPVRTVHAEGSGAPRHGDDPIDLVEAGLERIRDNNSHSSPMRRAGGPPGRSSVGGAAMRRLWSVPWDSVMATTS